MIGSNGFFLMKNMDENPGLLNLVVYLK